MKIGFIIVLFKTPKEEVKRLKFEIGKLNLDNYKIYFIDNTPNNLGYATGVNEGIKKAIIDNCELLIVANPDISLQGIKRKELLSWGEYFDVWGLATKQKVNVFYGGEIDRLRMSGGLINKKPPHRFIERDFVSGSLLLIKKEVVEKIGLFDETYFMYYEDVDFCYRSRRAGFKVGIDSKTVYEHFEMSARNPDKDHLLSQAREKFFKKYANIWQKIYEISKSGFLLNFFSLNISSFINKLLNFFLFIFLIRYLKPEEYGIYALVWAQVSLFSPIVDLGTTAYGIVDLPTEKKERFISLFNLRLAVSLIIFFLTIFVGFVMFKNNSRIVGYIFLTSFVIFSNMLSGSYLIKNAIERRLYNSSIISVIFNTFLIISLTTSLLFFRSLPVIFILIFIFYNFYSLANYFLIRKNFKQFLFSIDISTWRNFMKKSYIYILIGFFSGIYFKIDVFLLQFIKGASEVGIYSAGFKFFEALIFIAASYNITRTPVFAQLAKKNPELLLSVMKKDLRFLSLLGIGIISVTFFLSPIILPFFLKGNYFSAIKVIRIVIFALPLILLSSVFLNVIYVLKKAYIIIIIFLLQVFLNFFLNLIFIPKYSYIASSYITVLSEIINIILLTVIFLLIWRKKLNKTTNYL